MFTDHTANHCLCLLTEHTHTYQYYNILAAILKYSVQFVFLGHHINVTTYHNNVCLDIQLILLLEHGSFRVLTHKHNIHRCLTGGTMNILH